VSGRGIGRIDRRRRRHGHHGLRRLHEDDRQRTAGYNFARGRLTPLVRERIRRGARVLRRKDAQARRAAWNATAYLPVGLARGPHPGVVIVDEELPPGAGRGIGYGWHM